MGTYDTYILEIAGNNRVPKKYSTNGVDDLSYFDHCNELRYKKLEGSQKKYTNYFLTNDMFSRHERRITTRRTLSLYQHTLDRAEKDPFADNADAPFLILMQICLGRGGLQDIQNACLINSKQDVEAALKTTEMTIQQTVEDFFTTAELGNIVLRIFRSSTTDDFCLVLRTACIDLVDKAMDCMDENPLHAYIYTTAWKRKRKLSQAEYSIYVPIQEKSVGDVSYEPNTKIDMKMANKRLYEYIIALDRYRMYFAQENRSFQDLFQATKALYWSFASYAWEKDTELDWQVWHEDMRILCSSIEQQMTAYCNGTPDTDEKRLKFRLALLRNWRENILAIDNYTRLLQRANDQGDRSLMYETQTIDAKKIMIAYREAMRIYYRGFEDYASQKPNPLFAPVTKIEPILYPTLSQDKVEVTTLFSNMTACRQPELKPSVCKVPSFEYFERLYDFLPLLMHEAAHSIRVMERGKRNRFLVSYTLKHVFSTAIQQLIQEASGANHYENMETATESLRSAFKSVAETKIVLEDNADFEQTADAIGAYLRSIFPDDTNEDKDFEKARKRLGEIFAKAFFSNDSSELSNGGFNRERAEELLMKIIEVKNKKLKDLLSAGRETEDVFLQVADFYLPAKIFDKKTSAIRKQWENTQTISALNEYIFLMQKLHRAYRTYFISDEKFQNPEEQRRLFLEEVFQKYQEIKCHGDADSHHDPEMMFFSNYMGLLGKNGKIFYRQCKKAFDRIPSSKIQKCKGFRTQIYRETCADVMMAVSLHLDAFGYCRQILRVISDTMQTYSFDRYESLDFGRFRTVTALLLLKADIAQITEYGKDEYQINGKCLLGKSECYCENYLKYIRKIIAKREPAESVELLSEFLGDINMQFKESLKDFKNFSPKKTLLYAFLHGGPENWDQTAMKRWEEYKGLMKICEKYKQHFWRLECFCIGLQHIISKDNVIVEGVLFEHMEELYRMVVAPDSSSGCVWEKNLWPCMQAIKKKVGDYYNNPESVLQVSYEEKLETTIDFIQNFYYHNRVAIIYEGESANEEKPDRGNAAESIVS